jgi:Cu-Zn family superoxide dismutase
MKGTAEGSQVGGTVRFEDVKGGLKISAHLTNVPPGNHGFHIHEFGACDDAGKAAGGHYNPLHSIHGMAVKDGVKKAHAGDLGNITADSLGNASLEVTLPKVMLSGGKYAVAGRAVILHEKADDFGHPLYKDGGRIALDLIMIAKP